MIGGSIAQALQSLAQQQDVPASESMFPSTDIASLAPPKVYGPMAEETQQPDQSQPLNLGQMLGGLFNTSPQPAQQGWTPPAITDPYKARQQANAYTGADADQQAMQQKAQELAALYGQQQPMAQAPTHPGTTLAQLLVGGLLTALGGRSGAEVGQGYTQGLMGAQEQQYQDKMRQFQLQQQYDQQARQDQLKAKQFEYEAAYQKAGMSKQEAQTLAAQQIAQDERNENRSFMQYKNDQDLRWKKEDSYRKTLEGLDKAMKTQRNPAMMAQYAKAVNSTLDKMESEGFVLPRQRMTDQDIKDTSMAALMEARLPYMDRWEKSKEAVMQRYGFFSPAAIDELKRSRDAIVDLMPIDDAAKEMLRKTFQIPDEDDKTIAFKNAALKVQHEKAWEDYKKTQLGQDLMKINQLGEYRKALAAAATTRAATGASMAEWHRTIKEGKGLIDKALPDVEKKLKALDQKIAGQENKRKAMSVNDAGAQAAENEIQKLYGERRFLQQQKYDMLIDRGRMSQEVLDQIARNGFQMISPDLANAFGLGSGQNTESSAGTDPVIGFVPMGGGAAVMDTFTSQARGDIGNGGKSTKPESLPSKQPPPPPALKPNQTAQLQGATVKRTK